MLSHQRVRHRALAQQHAVYAVAQRQAGAGAFQVNVAGAVLQSVVEQRVQQAHHRAGLLGQLQGRQLMHHLVCPPGLKLRHRVHGSKVFAAVLQQAGKVCFAHALLKHGRLGQGF